MQSTIYTLYPICHLGTSAKPRSSESWTFVKRTFTGMGSIWRYIVPQSNTIKRYFSSICVSFDTFWKYLPQPWTFTYMNLPGDSLRTKFLNEVPIFEAFLWVLSVNILIEVHDYIYVIIHSSELPISPTTHACLTTTTTGRPAATPTSLRGTSRQRPGYT